MPLGSVQFFHSLCTHWTGRKRMVRLAPLGGFGGMKAVTKIVAHGTYIPIRHHSLLPLGMTAMFILFFCVSFYPSCLS